MKETPGKKCYQSDLYVKPFLLTYQADKMTSEADEMTSEADKMTFKADEMTFIPL